MQRLIQQIEYCLYQERRVVVPQLGCFYLQQQSAREDKASAKLIPPYNNLCYKPDIRLSDGVLQKAYARNLNISTPKAELLLRKDVEDLSVLLAARGELELGNLGTLFTQGTPSTLQFRAAKEHPFSSEYIGLTDIAKLPVLLPTEKRRPGHSDALLYIPINLKVLKYSAAAAVLLALGSLLPFQQTEKNPAAYQAGFVPEIISQSPQAFSLEVSAVKPNLELVDSGKTTESGVENRSSKKLQRGLDITQTEEPYRVVLASLQSLSKAEAFIQVQNSSLELKIYHSGQYFRVYSSAHKTKTAAEQAASGIRKTTPFTDAWVHKASYK